MLIDEYFEQISEAIASCVCVQNVNLICDKRSDYQGFIRGEINFTNSSLLYCREFVNVKRLIERGMYSYQYMDAAKSLIFRYDDTQHHQKLNLPNYPHHKHEGREDHILSSNAPMLADVLTEIERLIG